MNAIFATKIVLTPQEKAELREIKPGLADSIMRAGEILGRRSDLQEEQAVLEKDIATLEDAETLRGGKAEALFTKRERVRLIKKRLDREQTPVGPMTAELRHLLFRAKPLFRSAVVQIEANLLEKMREAVCPFYSKDHLNDYALRNLLAQSDAGPALANFNSRAWGMPENLIQQACDAIDILDKILAGKSPL